MKRRTRLIIVIGLGVLILGTLLVLSLPAKQQVTGISVTPNAGGSTSGLPSTTLPAAEPTMTAEEQKAVEEVKRNNPQSASSPDQCSTILQTQPGVV